MEKDKQVIIEARSLTKKYKDLVALENLNLQVQRGEIFGFLGHNGAGKTTTVNILTTLLAPTSGSATICGFDIAGDSLEVRRKIGYLPENVKFYEDLTAFENLDFFAKLSGLRRPAEKIRTTLKFLEFQGFEHKKWGNFQKACANGSASRKRSSMIPKSCF